MTTEIQKRDNIASLAFFEVVRPLVKAADPVSWILFVLFLALSVISIVLHVNYSGSGPETWYNRYFLAFWYGTWGLLVLATIGPMFNIARERNEAPLGILIGVGVVHLVTFIAISVVVLIHYGKPEAVTGLMAAFAAAIMVGIGWVVQHQSSARASRRAHTFSILMQSRLSKEFQAQMAKRLDFYYAGVVVAPQDAALITKKGLLAHKEELSVAKSRELSQAREEAKAGIALRYDELEALAVRKHESLQGVKYLLNFYEFMAAAICKRELDEPLLRASVMSIVRGLYEDTKHVRSHVRESQSRAFCELDRVMQLYWADPPDRQASKD